MEPEDNDKNEQKQDEKELGGVNRLLQEGSKKAKNKFSMMFKKLMASIVVPFLIKFAPLLIAVAIVSLAVTWWNNEFGQSNVSAEAIDSILENEEQTQITLSDDGNGYYFKISSNSFEKYIEELNKVYAQGYFSAEIDEEDIIPEEEIEEIDEKFTSKDIQEWFGTDNEELCKAYFMKMLRAHIASTYPRLGNYGTSNGNNLIADNYGNPVDSNGNYIAQGVVQIKRTSINDDGTKGSVRDLSYIPYNEFSAKIQNGDTSVLNNFSFDPSKDTIYYAIYTTTMESVTDASGNTTTTEKTEIREAPPVSYSSLVSMCNMPFDFLFTLLQVSHNPEWVMSVIDLILEDSEVVIMIQDQLNVVDYTEVSDNAIKVLTRNYEYVELEEPEEDSNGDNGSNVNGVRRRKQHW